MKSPLINPDYILCPTASVTDYGRIVARDEGPIVTDADLEWIEEHVGMGAGAWDTVSPKEIVEMAWHRFAMKMKGQCPL